MCNESSLHTGILYQPLWFSNSSLSRYTVILGTITKCIVTNGRRNVSESITHTAVVDDALAIVDWSDRFCEPFKEAAVYQRDIARLGGITRHGDRHDGD